MRARLVGWLRRRPGWLIGGGRVLLLRLQNEYSGRKQKARCPFAKVHVSFLIPVKLSHPWPPARI
jgi:hypothetical protein